MLSLFQSDNERRHATPEVNMLLPRAEEDNQSKRELIEMLDLLKKIVKHK